ncbi:MAG: hypothetical protein DRI84_00285 [Bacteroidetes bacterium]|nr:MAG: hypothetical protein DRI84_00285 [Bacteroidota bacterium]
MKNYSKIFQLGILMISMLFIASCSSKKSSLTAIPKDAGFVMVVDGAALTAKSGVQDFTQTKAYKKLISEMTEEELSNLSEFDYILKDSKESGLGINEEFIVFTKISEGEPIVGLNLLIVDKAKLDALMKSIMEREDVDVEIVEDADISTMLLADNEGVFAWNNTQFLVLAHEDLAAEALVNEAKALLKQGAKESISSNSVYADFYAKKKDVSIWFDYDMIFKNMPPAQQMMLTSQLPFNMSGSSFNAYINFEKGKVVAEYESVLNDEMKDFIKDYKFINDDFDVDVLKLMPETSFANMEMSINFYDYYHMFMDMYKEKQVDTEMYTKQVEQELGMSIDDILNSFSGEIAFSLHGVQFAEKIVPEFKIVDGEYKMTYDTINAPELMYSAVIKYNDDKVWGIIEENAAKAGMEKTDNYYHIAAANLSIAYYNNVMVITNDKGIIDKLNADGSLDPNMSSSEAAKHLSNFATYAEVNMDIDSYPQEVVDYLKSEAGESSDAILKLLSTYKRLQVVPEDMYHAKIILEMKDDSKNSLEIIINNFDDSVDLISQN